MEVRAVAKDTGISPRKVRPLVDMVRGKKVDEALTILRFAPTPTARVVGNVDHQSIKLGKAGRKRWLGWRPTVRGSAMSPRDHPHGGGEGRSPIGMPGPKTPWGKPALGYRTRKSKATDKMIVKRREK